MGSIGTPLLKGCIMRKCTTYTTQCESAYFPAPYANNQLLCSLCGPKRSRTFDSAGFNQNRFSSRSSNFCNFTPQDYTNTLETISNVKKSPLPKKKKKIFIFCGVGWGGHALRPPLADTHYARFNWIVEPPFSNF